jgi:hypothetical protein
MSRLFAGAVTFAGSLALVAAGLAATAAPPAAAVSYRPGARSSPVGASPDNRSYGAYATGPIPSAQLGLAVSPSGSTSVPSASIPGLLTTGTTVDAGSDLTAYSRVSRPAMATATWVNAGTTYTLAFTASQVSSSCRSDDRFAGTAGIMNGVLTETETTGATPPRRTTHVIHVPRHPPAGAPLTYHFGGAIVMLNYQIVTDNGGGSEVQAVAISFPSGASTQTLQLATAVCSALGAPCGIVNGGFETGNLTGWDEPIPGSVGVETTDVHSGHYAAQAGLGFGPAVLEQNFIADGTSLSFWYKRQCAGFPSSASIDLLDITANTSTPLVADACSNDPNWLEGTVAITPGDQYVFLVTNNAFGPPSDTLLDDVAVS